MNHGSLSSNILILIEGNTEETLRGDVEKLTVLPIKFNTIHLHEHCEGLKKIMLFFSHAHLGEHNYFNVGDLQGFVYFVPLNILCTT